MNNLTWIVMLSDGTDFNRAAADLMALGFTPTDSTPENSFISGIADETFDERARNSYGVRIVQRSATYRPCGES